MVASKKKEKENYNRPVYSNGNIQQPAPCWSQTNHQPQDRSTIYRI